MKNWMIAASSLALIAACGGKDETGQDTPLTATPAGESETKLADVTVDNMPDFGPDGLDRSTWDAEVKPGADFFRYANGAWLEEFEIPSDESRFGAFTVLRDLSEARVRLIIEELAAKTPPTGTLEGKIAAYYNAYLDTDAINARGMEPVRAYLDQIAAIETREDLARAFGTPGFASPVGGYIWIDSKNPERYISYITQSGLGLPDRDYYLVDNEKNLELRAGYVEYLTTILTEIGYEAPAETAERILGLETKIAAAQWDRTLGRNRDLTYNLVTLDELKEFAGGFDVDAYLEAAMISGQTEFVMNQQPPTAEELEALTLTDEQRANLAEGGLPALMKLAEDEPIEDWKAYLAARFVSSNSSVLPATIDDASFALYGTLLNGQPEQRARWKRAVSATEGALGEGIGKLYAERYFPPENKAAMDELVANLRTAMALNLDDLEWMGEDTRVQARDKLDKFTPKIGYPENFETYEDLTVEAGRAFENARASSMWSYRDNISKLGKPIDRTEWGMLPQTVNAYYNPSLNEIVFPAAILQPPFFNISADPAVNYGAIGGVIGHEIGHGFDDQGSKSDGDGVLRNWWTPEDKAAFEARTDALVEQYNAFCPLEDKCVNGRLALGENIGDLGGLSLAYRAYQLSLDTNGDGVVSEDEQAPVIDGLTGDQRFFLAWAQVWKGKYRDDAMRAQLQRGPHSPGQFRVNGIVRNMDVWYEAFGVEEGDALYLPPEERISIW